LLFHPEYLDEPVPNSGHYKICNTNAFEWSPSASSQNTIGWNDERCFPALGEYDTFSHEPYENSFDEFPPF
jgi:hypothetical protein